LQDRAQRRLGVRFAGEQHLRAPLGHVTHEAVAGAAGHHDLAAVQRMRALALEMVRQLFAAEQR
jgi:hypothetical protein